MTAAHPRQPETESRASLLRRAARRTAWVAGVFCVVVTVAMLLNLFHAGRNDPVTSPHLASLRTRLYHETDPAAREVLVAEIRELDLHLRRIELHSRWFLRTGAWLLAGGILVLLVSLKYASPPRIPLPRPGDASESGDLHRITRRAVEILGLALVATTVLVALLSGRDTPQWFTRAEAPETAGDPALADTETPAAPDYPPEGAFQAQWYRFRGPAGQGHAAYENVPTDWDGTTGRNIRWRSEPVPLPGESSPVVWDGHLFITGATATEREVYAYDTETGALRWRYAVASTEEPPEVMEETGFAAPTAATDGRRVYALFATGDLVAVDFDGRDVWTRALGVPDNPYGHASSLTVWRNLLLVQYDHGYTPDDGNSVLYAIDTATGEEVWRQPRPVQGAWSSPAVFDTPEGPQLVIAGSPHVISYDPGTGRERWRARVLSGDVAPSPVYAHGMVYVAQEFAWVSAIAADGRGDVTETHVRWQGDQGLPDTVSPLVVEDLLYLFNTYGIISCYDALSGEFLWEHILDAEFNASPVLAGDTVYLIDRDGVTHQFAPDREGYRETGRAELGEPSNATPAFLDGRIYLRGAEHLFAVE